MIDNEVLTQDEQLESTQSTEESPSPEQQSPAVEDKAAYNYRKLREKAERMERERDEAMRKIQEFEARSQAHSSPAEDEEINLEPDALAEGKHISKVSQKIKRLENELKQYRQQSVVESTETRLKAQFSDFDRIVSKENIESLRESYPEVAASIHANPDLYGRAVAAYTLIKQFGIAKDQLIEADRALVQKNAAKPRPMASISPQQGDSPLSKANAFANGLTDDLKNQLWKEMTQTRRAS